MTLSIPQIGINPFLEGSEEGKHMVTSQIGQAYRNIGYFTLNGNEDHQDLVDRVFSANREFHQLHLEEKEEILNDKPGNSIPYI